MSGTPTQNPDGEKSSAEQRSTRMALTAVSTLLGSVLMGVGVGYLIDRAAGTSPTWTVSLGALFIIAGLYQLVRVAMKS